MHIHININIHIHTHTYTYTLIHIYIHKHTYTYSLRSFAFFSRPVMPPFICLPPSSSECRMPNAWWDNVALIESVLVFVEKVRLYLMSRPKLPAYWDLQEAEFLCFLSSQQLEKEKVKATDQQSHYPPLVFSSRLRPKMFRAAPE